MKAVLKKWVLFMVVALMAGSAWADPIKMVTVSKKLETNVERLQGVKDGEKLLLFTPKDKYGYFITFVAYFCDWEKPVIYIHDNNTEGTCVFKNNQGFEDYLKAYD